MTRSRRAIALHMHLTLALAAICLAGCPAPAQQQPQEADATDLAHVHSGTTVRAVSEGVNPPPYDVRAAIGDGSHLSYPGALPNWFELDLGQVRTIRAIEIDWRYHDRSPDDFDLRFGRGPDGWDRTLEVRDVGGQGKYWYRILEEPIRARYVRMDVLSLHEIQWTVINRVSLYATSRIPRLVEENAERYAWLAARLHGLVAEAQQAGAIVPAALEAATARAGELSALLEGDAAISQQRWAEIEGAFRGLQDEAHEAEGRLSFTRLRREVGDGPAVGAVGAMTKVFRNAWPDDVEDELRLRCARNERESGQVLVAAVERDLANVEVACDALRGPATLEEAVETGLVCYVRTRDAPYLTHHVGLWPDGISPAAPFDLPAGQVQPVWVTVAIPADAPAGEYTTRLHIRPEGEAEMTVPFSVRVWDFTLPERISLPNVFSLSKLLVDAWYRDRDFGWEELKDDYYDFWLEHRLNPTSLYGQMLPTREGIDPALTDRMSAFVIKYIYSGGHRAEEEYFQGALEDLAAWDELLAERDLYDRAIVYLADEPAEKASVTAEINRRARIIGERFPRMRRLLVLTRPIDRAFDGSVDVWCPVVSAMRPADVEEAHERGERCWWYTVGHFFNLDRPAAAARTMPWLTFKHGLDGILYWNIQSSWRRPNRPSRFHPEPGETVWEAFEPAGHGGANGIGNMCYPGHDGRPWSSQRLEILREAMEDYEYLLLLREALADAPESPHRELLNVPEQLSTEYSVGTDADFIVRRRDSVGRALHDLANE